MKADVATKMGNVKAKIDKGADPDRRERGSVRRRPGRGGGIFGD